VILLVVGTQAPFDRLVRAMDEWAAARAGTEVFAQVGTGQYVPRQLRWTRFVSPSECRELTLRADLVVAHAGMGTVLSALELGKPCVVMPRCAERGEHRNDHQLATARRLEERGLVRVAWDEGELPALLEAEADRGAGRRIRPFADEPLVEGLRQFLLETAGGGL
jgi:UDP-N-acetylglucosamine transferase subunit ALG13